MTDRRLRVLCWNMGAAFGFRGEKHRAAWAWLNDQDVDVALLQELVPLEDLAKQWGSVIFAGKYQNWGSAVLARESDYEAWQPSTDSHPWLCRVRGAVAVAQPKDGEGHWLASIHSDASSFEKTNRRYPSTYADLPSREGILRCSEAEMWEIEPIAHELAQVLQGKTFLAGGDLNSSLLFDGKDDSNARLFANLGQQGFTDLRARHFPSEVQTYFKENTRPFQLDHVYADPQTEAEIVSWEVVREVATDLGLSDHAPIRLELAATE
jgi:exonuclease III